VSENQYSPIAVTAVLLAVLMWASSFALIKVGLDYLPPIGFAAIRFGIGSLIMVAVLFLRKSPRESLKEFRNDWKILTFIGIVGLAFPNALLNVGLQFTTASLSSIIQSAGPVFTLIFAVLLLGEGLGPDKILGSIIAIIGTFLLIAQDGIDLSNSTFVGNLIVVLSSICYSLSGVVTKVALKKHNPVEIVGWMLIIGSLLLLLMTPFEPGATYHFTEEIVVIILFLAVFPGCLAFILYNWVLRTKEVSQLAFFIYLIPVFAIIMSYLIIEELLPLQTILLGGVVILGVAIAQYRLVSRLRGIPHEA
jgi:drug/metabolite transporter (DMT)-like permease